MSLILNIETATKTCSVALAKDGELIQLVESTEDGFQHNEKLFLFINQVMEKSGFDFKDLSGIAVSSGPGSYTGLRIGTSAAKGLSYGLGIPLISVNSLLSLAALATGPYDYVIPMFDARRMEVYSAVYNKSLKELKPTDAIIVEKGFGLEFLEKGKTLFLGDGMEKCKGLLTHENALFSDKFISASSMCLLSHQKFVKNKFEDLAYFEPFYLKDFIAGKPKKLL